MRIVRFDMSGAHCDKDISSVEKDLFENMWQLSQPQIRQLYVLGNLLDKDEKSLAVVGARRMSNYGKRVCRSLVGEIAAAGITIVSGLMYGIDLEAHEVALKTSGRTVAILGYGFNHLKKVGYAKSIVSKILKYKKGAVISEYQPDHPPDKWTFPRRNRLVAGFSKAVLIIEAGKRSGSLITASMALDQGKDIFVVPGSIFDNRSVGKHALIKQGAILVDSSEDIFNYFGIKPLDVVAQAVKSLAGLEKRIYEKIKENNDINANLLLAEIPPSKLNAVLTSLEMKRIISKTKDGKWFVCM